jgi:hypothetical protein
MSKLAHLRPPPVLTGDQLATGRPWKRTQITRPTMACVGAPPRIVGFPLLPKVFALADPKLWSELAAHVRALAPKLSRELRAGRFALCRLPAEAETWLAREDFQLVKRPRALLAAAARLLEDGYAVCEDTEA